MKKLILCATFLFATACKGGLDAKLDDLGKIRDAMCACKDKACADEQHDKYIAWKKSNSKDDKPSESQMKKYEDIRKELQECRRKQAESGDPDAKPTPPAAPAAPTPPATTP
jgi:hypothetical protein